MDAFPRFRAVAERAVLVEFADTAGPQAYGNVLALDNLLETHPLTGFVQAVPAFVSLLVEFDPILTDHPAVETALRSLLRGPEAPRRVGDLHEIPVCYDADLAPDLQSVATATGRTPEAVIAAHLSAEYTVGIYGFAPGYAYLSGVPEPLHLPRKPRARRDVAAGSVLIAGAQCIVSTLKMPTGWWIIGRTATRILLDDPARPFLFNIGDRVRFRRITRVQFDDAIADGLR